MTALAACAGSPAPVITLAASADSSSRAQPAPKPTAIAASASAAPAAPPQPALPLKVTVTCAKTEVTPAEAKGMMLTFTITNEGSTAVHAGVESSVLLVNGKPHKGFRETVAEINNDKFDSLPPGESARFHYVFQTPGKIMPGEYLFVLRIAGNDSPPLTVRVVP